MADVNSWLPGLLGVTKIQSAGAGVTARKTLNFEDAVVTDDPTNDRTNVVVRATQQLFWSAPQRALNTSLVATSGDKTVGNGYVFNRETTIRGVRLYNTTAPKNFKVKLYNTTSLVTLYSESQHVHPGVQEFLFGTPVELDGADLEETIVISYYDLAGADYYVLTAASPPFASAYPAILGQDVISVGSFEGAAAGDTDPSVALAGYIAAIEPIYVRTGS